MGARRSWSGATAAGLGLSLLIVAALLVHHVERTSALSIGLMVIGGIVLLTIAFAGLALFYAWLNLANANEAFGLPAGSIRALLAFGLVILYLGVAAQLFTVLWEHPVWERVATIQDSDKRDPAVPNGVLAVPRPGKEKDRFDVELYQ